MRRALAVAITLAAWARLCGASEPDPIINCMGRTVPVSACPETRLVPVELKAELLAAAVRAGSVKRVAAAVGEGSVCIQLVHKVLSE